MLVNQQSASTGIAFGTSHPMKAKQTDHQNHYENNHWSIPNQQQEL
jgi:hypothetical protein